ncbi:hypothetical protein MNBD_DELTA02-721 [hydrothermal vent metagenome]|uniref:Uncharacterized protein n=1 Tax=hydrothermal vent metagenome TaxID=652676 RepID=A0A3B0V2R6_9ZZZZ
MAISLSAAYLAQLKKGLNTPNVILELALDSGTLKFGYSTGGFSDVQPILKSVSSLQNRLDTRSGFATLGQISFVIVGRENFRSLIQNNYLKNRRVTRKDGFAGLAYTDYAATFTGKVLDWYRQGDELTITVADEAIKTTKKIPVENSTKTQNLDYRNMNPVDIMQDILKNQLGISASFVDDTQFDSEQTAWLSIWAFDRVLTSPKQAIKYLSELQQETNSFIVHDGEKITFKVFAPPAPGAAPDEWTDTRHILKDSLSQKSGYKDGFFNRVIVYYDYDESGSDDEDNFEAAIIAVDAASQSSAEWDEIKTRTIKSKWIRSFTYTAASNITGVTLYHISTANGAGAGDGTLAYNLINNTLTWRAPGGTAGEAVKLSKDGKFQVFDIDKTKWVRVIVETASLPGGDQSDTIVITAMDGKSFATGLASQLLRRYRYPVSTVSFSVDINNVSKGGNYLKPTDLVDVTTDEAGEKGEGAWDKTRLMITSLRPDFAGAEIKIDAIDTGMTRRYGFIAPSGYPDYGTATDEQRERAFIGRASDNMVNDGSFYVDGFYIW